MEALQIAIIVLIVVITILIAVIALYFVVFLIQLIAAIKLLKKVISEAGYWISNLGSNATNITAKVGDIAKSFSSFKNVSIALLQIASVISTVVAKRKGKKQNEINDTF